MIAQILNIALPELLALVVVRLEAVDTKYYSIEFAFLKPSCNWMQLDCMQLPPFLADSAWQNSLVRCTHIGLLGARQVSLRLSAWAGKWLVI